MRATHAASTIFDEATTAFTHDGVDNLTELEKWSKPIPTCSDAICQVSDIDVVLTGG